jgi:hypothetical protein
MPNKTVIKRATPAQDPVYQVKVMKARQRQIYSDYTRLEFALQYLKQWDVGLWTHDEAHAKMKELFSKK